MNRSNLQSGGSPNHWIILKLAGVKSNRDGQGTKKVTTSLGTQYNQARISLGCTCNSLWSAFSLILHLLNLS